MSTAHGILGEMGRSLRVMWSGTAAPPHDVSVARTAREVSDALAQLPVRRDNREAFCSRHALTEISARPGEYIPVCRQRITVAIGTPSEVSRVLRWGERLASALARREAALDLQPAIEGTARVFQLRGDAAFRVTEALHEDSVLRREIGREARRCFGDTLPLAPSEMGAVVDVRALARVSTPFAQVLAWAAQAAEERAEELVRRELLSRYMDASFDSVLDRVVRDLDQSISILRSGETLQHLLQRVRHHSRLAMRAAWYISATPRQRLSLGLAREGAVQVAATSSAVDFELDPWMEEGAYSALPDRTRQSITAALNASTVWQAQARPMSSGRAR